MSGVEMVDPQLEGSAQHGEGALAVGSGATARPDQLHGTKPDPGH
jgi:hypothetical protein